MDRFSTSNCISEAAEVSKKMLFGEVSQKRGGEAARTSQEYEEQLLKFTPDREDQDEADEEKLVLIVRWIDLMVMDTLSVIRTMVHKYDQRSCEL